MKELSIEEKAKAYDKALEIMKAYYNRTQFSSISNSKEEIKTIEKAFPELKESEDESIFEEIYKDLHTYYIMQRDKFVLTDIKEIWNDKWSKAKAWLEKQGKNNMGISEATKKKLEENLNKALEKETPESWNEFLEKQGETSPILSNSSNIGKDEQNPAWSEEDEKMIESCIFCFEKDMERAKSKFCESDILPDIIDGYKKKIDWFKFLKDRIQPQPKQKWSEEDEAIYYGVIETEQYMLDVVNGIKKFNVGNISIKEECTRELNWLKSLRPQNRWKPSEEQMKALDEARSLANNCGEESAFDLRTLHEQLKKLREGDV